MSWRASATASVSLTRVDLPEPETPVTHTRRAAGMRRSTDLRLLPVAPDRCSQGWSSATGRRAGISMARAPLRYWPVSDCGSVCTASGVPCATTWPPCSPAPGPMSTTQSAQRIMSSSCSTTMTLLPRSRRCCRVPISRSLSRWCRPMDGSSSTYMTPVRPEPIWLASRMRWASPPEIVSALRSSDR
ncbi:Uncharacterised protein [Bordetella pertussis]|nr:Uncharacterised protein [Bordetella pertussis]